MYSVNCLGKINPCPADLEHAIIANSVAPDQLASVEANWSGPALFATQYLNLYQQPVFVQFVSSKLIGRKLEVGVASWFIQLDKG